MQYSPHDYQKYAIDFIETHPQAAVLLGCGLGKTSITLTALNDLMFDRFEVRKPLIIAPIRVCRNSWAAEIAKWDHLNGMTYSLILGTKEQRLAALRQKADLYIINRENVQCRSISTWWLSMKCPASKIISPSVSRRCGMSAPL